MPCFKGNVLSDDVHILMYPNNVRFRLFYFFFGGRFEIFLFVLWEYTDNQVQIIVFFM